MKRIMSILVYLLIAKSLWAVNKYSIGDNLYVIGQNVNLRSAPNLSSTVLQKLNKGSVVKTLETKFDKNGDVSLSEDKSKWKSIITGRWTKIKYNDNVGYIFDAYLSHYNFKQIVNSELCIVSDTIQVQNYELYIRTICLNGVINENGLGMEWSKALFMIPDFTFEEAILYVKPSVIDYSYGTKKWEIKHDIIKLEESDGVSNRTLEIVKCGEYVIIEITDGV